MGAGEMANGSPTIFLLFNNSRIIQTKSVIYDKIELGKMFA